MDMKRPFEVDAVRTNPVCRVYKIHYADAGEEPGEAPGDAPRGDAPSPGDAPRGEGLLTPPGERAF
jgi:hypothetical protein